MADIGMEFLKRRIYYYPDFIPGDSGTDDTDSLDKLRFKFDCLKTIAPLLFKLDKNVKLKNFSGLQGDDDIAQEIVSHIDLVSDCSNISLDKSRSVFDYVADLVCNILPAKHPGVSLLFYRNDFFTNISEKLASKETDVNIWDNYVGRLLSSDRDMVRIYGKYAEIFQSAETVRKNWSDSSYQKKINEIGTALESSDLKKSKNNLIDDIGRLVRQTAHGRNMALPKIFKE
jgi:hypothetical protein